MTTTTIDQAELLLASSVINPATVLDARAEITYTRRMIHREIHEALGKLGPDTDDNLISEYRMALYYISEATGDDWTSISYRLLNAALIIARADETHDYLVRALTDASYLARAIHNTHTAQADPTKTRAVAVAPF